MEVGNPNEHNPFSIDHNRIDQGMDVSCCFSGWDSVNGYVDGFGRPLAQNHGRAPDSPSGAPGPIERGTPGGEPGARQEPGGGPERAHSGMTPGQEPELPKAPDLTEHVLGFREWRIRDHALRSLTWNYKWETAEQEATITHDEEGLYAWHKSDRYMRPRVSMGGWVVQGAVIAWGDIYVHQEGFRATNMKIVALSFDPAWKWEDVERYKRWSLREYKCRAVPLDELAGYAKRFGSPVPNSLRPTDEEYEKWLDG